MKTVIVVDGRKDLSKKFVAHVRRLGYNVRKINPAKANKEVVRIFVPSGHSDETKLFKASQWFLEKQNAYYFYVEKGLREFLRGKHRVAILVNISNVLKNELMSDFEAFSVLVSDGQEVSLRHDWTIFNDEKFNEKVRQLLRVLTKDIEDVKYKEIE